LTPKGLYLSKVYLFIFGNGDYTKNFLKPSCSVWHPTFTSLPLALILYIKKNGDFMVCSKYQILDRITSEINIPSCSFSLDLLNQLDSAMICINCNSRAELEGDERRWEGSYLLNIKEKSFLKYS
jgi:hypothetical protein